MLKQMSLIDQIVAEIEEKISTGQFKSGDMLASQDELAKTMGVSRASLREAFNRLQLMGLIEIKQGRGTFVRKLTPGDFMSSLDSFLTIKKESAIELLEARLEIESSVAKMAAEKGDKEKILKIEESLIGMGKAIESNDLDKFIAKDVSFHVAIAESCDNQIMMKIVAILRRLMKQLIERIFYDVAVDKRELMHVTYNFHESVYNAILNRDPETAKSSMQDHLGDVMERIMNSNKF
ncbi:MAG: FadR family transcriptional regulator [Deltaproteobacteria bacterium]|jgi:GntR family transcriptional regulator, transcriptional repressor for pyruvate dehydrogenase complex|nr:FadR family transcriptional regulator [Deltaproteobacteria bacterium]